MASAITTNPSPAASKLADLVEQHAAGLIPLIVAALRGQSAAEQPAAAETPGSATSTIEAADGDPSAPANDTADGDSQQANVVDWKQIEAILHFAPVWPAPPRLRAKGQTQLREHYGPMAVYEGHDSLGVVRLAVGTPQEQAPLYGEKERGWATVWEVINGRPRRQLAVFVDVDDFETTGDRASLISGKDGAAKKGFAPNERYLLPPIYDDMRVEVQRDRISGPNSRNRLVVLARDDEVDTMLNHALAHLRLRS